MLAAAALGLSRAEGAAEALLTVVKAGIAAVVGLFLLGVAFSLVGRNRSNQGRGSRR
jgi:hypothetical protein